jgi:hypothetical protein
MASLASLASVPKEMSSGKPFSSRDFQILAGRRNSPREWKASLSFDGSKF